MINVRIQPQDTKQNALAPRITVVGVGGAGCNAVDNMIALGMEGVEFVVCNADAQALQRSLANKKVQLGLTTTGGLGAGTKPEVGRVATEESLDQIMSMVDGSHMVFVTAGMGGGTGTGGAPIIAKACKEAGILTVGVVTKPFHFEGPVCMRAADAGIDQMQKYVDTLIVIPNQNLFRIANERTTFKDACKLADNVLQSAVRGVTDLMVMPGLVNLDFNDIKTTMTEMGKAMMGTGEATGDRRAVMAADAAINNPLLDDVTMKGAKGVIINIAGGTDMTLFEIDEACNRIREEVDVDANIIFGTSVDENLQGSLRVTVLATGIETEAERKARDDETKKQMTTAKAFSYGGPRANVNETTVAPARTYAAVAEQVAQQTVPVPAPAQVVPTAQIQGNTFIPPQPLEYDQLAAFDRTVSYDQVMGGVAVQGESEPVDLTPVLADVVSEPVAHGATMDTTVTIHSPTPVEVTVGPAAQTAAVPHSRRAVEPTAEPALSLFQRITQRVRQTVEQAFDTNDGDDYGAPQHRAASARVQPSVMSAPVATAVAVSPARQPVDMAKPAKASPQAELDLEIPAFLRRQAS
jgi:cell division protein FtsZ